VNKKISIFLWLVVLILFVGVRNELMLRSNEAIPRNAVKRRLTNSAIYWRSNEFTGEDKYDFNALHCHDLVWKPPGNYKHKEKKVAFALALTKMDIKYVHEVTRQIQHIRRVSDHDIVILVLRSGTTRDAINELDTRTNGFNDIDIIETDMGFEVSDLAEDFVKLQETNKNCCGLEEYVKLEAFNLPYDHILFLDLDAHPVKSPEIFFECDVDFMFAAGPSSPLNAGMFVFKPSRELYSHMIKTLKRVSHTFTNDLCFDGLGCGPCIRGYLCAGAEGPQGFLHYYFVKRQDSSLTVRQISTCLFDWLSDVHHVCEKDMHHSYPYIIHKDNFHRLSKLDESMILHVPTDNICRPKFWILGSQKLGTLALYLLMSQHRQVAPMLSNKLFDNGHHKPNNNDKEGALEFLSTDPRSIIETCGRKYTKFLVLLRDPVQQCHSIMLQRARHRTHDMDETSNISEFVLRDLNEFKEATLGDTEWATTIYPMNNVTASNCLNMGIYAAQLKRWFYHSSETNVRIYFTEHFQKHTSKVVHDALQFVGILSKIEHFKLDLGEDTRLVQKLLPHQHLTPTLRRDLKKTFDPYNRMLEELVNEETPWNY